MPQLYVVQPTSPTPEDEALSQEAVKLSLMFCRECAFKPLPYMARSFARWLLDGHEPAMIAEAIRRTAQAPRPTYAYLAAVMRNAAAAHQYTLAAFSQPYTRTVSAQRYQQRQYTEADLLAVSDDLIEEARKHRETCNQ